MKITFILRKGVKKNDVNSLATLHVRLRDGRNVDFQRPTNLTINPNMWDDDAEMVKSKVVCSDDFREEINTGVSNLKSFLNTEYKKVKGTEISKDWLEISLDKFYNPEKYKPKEIGNEKETSKKTKHIQVVELWNIFMESHDISEVRKKNNRVIGRILRRFELWIKTTSPNNKKYTLYIDDVTPDTIQDIWDFMANEHEYFKKYPEIYEAVSERRAPTQRGKNTLIDYVTRIKTFFNWAQTKKYTTNNPFSEYKIDEAVYGTPIFPSIEERNRLYACDMSDDPLLAQQRDIFVFQCLIGPRVGDYYKMTMNNVVDGAIEYVANKTSEDNPATLRIPLTKAGLEILERYYDPERESLLPFIWEQDYNEYIKKAFKRAGLTRVVTILDTKTMKPTQSTLDKEASSHMARRTFVGNMFKKVKNQQLVGSMSGHKANSKAFNRYSNIDDEMKNECIALIE